MHHKPLDGEVILWALSMHLDGYKRDTNAHIITYDLDPSVDSIFT